MTTGSRIERSKTGEPIEVLHYASAGATRDYAQQPCPVCRRTVWMRADAGNCGVCHVRPPFQCDRLAEPLTISREELEYQERDQ